MRYRLTTRWIVRLAHSIRSTRLMSKYSRPLLLLVVAMLHSSIASASEVDLAPGPKWKVAGLFSGDNNYYSVVKEGGQPLLKARFRPGLKTVILYREAPRATYKKQVWHRIGPSATAFRHSSHVNPTSASPRIVERNLFRSNGSTDPFYSACGVAA